jgi:DNA-binding response OmpR family regulator
LRSCWNWRASQDIDLDEEEARQVMRPHIVRLRRKIESDAQNPMYIQSVRGLGYRWGAPR